MNLDSNSMQTHIGAMEETLPLQATTAHISMTLELSKKVDLNPRIQKQL
jgi:hypothetical protein